MFSNYLKNNYGYKSKKLAEKKAQEVGGQVKIDEINGRAIYLVITTHVKNDGREFNVIYKAARTNSNQTY